MVLALLMALWLVALLYYLVGIGDALLFRLRLQQAADAGVYAAAVTQARGMNLIALLNMTMAALLAILVALRVTFFVAVTVAGILASLAWICPPCGAAAAPTSQVGVLANKAYEQLKEPIFRLLEVLHCSAVATASAMPAIAQLKAIRAIRQAPSGGADMGVVWPVYQRLPVEDGSAAELCARAGSYAGGLVADVTVGKFLPPAKKMIAGAIGGLAKAAAPAFCGASSGETLQTRFDSPIAERQQVMKPLPPAESPAIAACAAAMNSLQDDGDTPRDGALESCDQAAIDQRQAFAYDEHGDCQHELCETRLARPSSEACKPRLKSKIQHYTWQERQVTLTFKRLGSRWVETSRVDEPARIADSDKPPCGSDEALYGDAWHASPGKPLCIDAAALQEQLQRGESTVRYVEVLRVLHCEVEADNHHTMRVEAASPPPAEGTDVAGQSCNAGEQSRVPQRLPADMQFADERLQLRAIVWRRALPNEAERGVRLAAWQPSSKPQAVGSAIADQLAILGTLQVAQAEFFFDGSDEEPGEWLWHMHWRARYRRFRLPSEGANALPEMAQGIGGGALDSLRQLGNLIAH